MKPGATFLALALACAAGLFWYFHDYKGADQRQEAEDISKRIFKDLETNPPVEIGLREKTTETYMIKDLEGNWFIHRPIKDQGDRHQVNLILDHLKDIKTAETVIEGKADLYKFGLDKPTGTVTYKPTSGSARTLFFGSDTPTSSHVYAYLEGRDSVFLVDRGSKSILIKDLDTLRDRAVWRFDIADVTGIRSTFKDQAFTATRQNNSWSLGKGIEADEKKINEMLAEAGQLRINEFVNEAGKSLDDFGLGKAAQRLELTLGSRSNPMILYKGKANADGTGFFCRREGVPRIYTLQKIQVDKLTHASEYLENRDAFRLDPRAIQRVAIENNGQKFEVHRQLGAWSWSKGNTSNVKADFSIDSMIVEWAQAKSQSRLIKGGELTGKRATLSFYGPEDRELDVIRVDRGAGDVLRASSKALGHQAVLDSVLLEKLP